VSISGIAAGPAHRLRWTGTPASSSFAESMVTAMNRERAAQGLQF
jgi:hypothetical protein